MSPPADPSAELPTLITTPEPDPGEEHVAPTAAVRGRLSVNDRGCFELGRHLVLAPHGSWVSTDPLGIHVPGSDFIPVGAEVFGGGGYYPIDRSDHGAPYLHLATPMTKGVVTVWGLRLVRLDEPGERRPKVTRRPLP